MIMFIKNRIFIVKNDSTMNALKEAAHKFMLKLDEGFLCDKCCCKQGTQMHWRQGEWLCKNCEDERRKEGAYL